ARRGAPPTVPRARRVQARAPRCPRRRPSPARRDGRAAMRWLRAPARTRPPRARTRLREALRRAVRTRPDPDRPLRRARRGPSPAHPGDGLVAKVEEPPRRLLPRDAIALSERAAAARELVRRDRVLEERAETRDHRDRPRRGGEPPEREQALMHRSARRRAD